MPQDPVSSGGSEQISSGRCQSPGEVEFFQRNCEEPPEIIEGLLREGQLGAFAGPYGMGKSPTYADVTVRVINGLAWCGRKTSKCPVIVFDCETPGPDYKKAIRAISERLGVPVPRVPDDLEVYLERDSIEEPATAALLNVVSKPGHEPKLQLIRAALLRKPNALVLIDPLEMLFRLDTTKKGDILALYRELKKLLSEFPKAAILCTFNLRKQDRRNGRANLLSDPRSWLEEVCGSLDILNRSDVRLGVDAHDGSDEVRVINGIVRGREMHPILLRSVRDSNDELAGFEQVRASELDLTLSMSKAQKAHWDKLPAHFRFEEQADKNVPRSTLSRITTKALSLGVLSKDENGVFHKRIGVVPES